MSELVSDKAGLVRAARRAGIIGVAICVVCLVFVALNPALISSAQGTGRLPYVIIGINNMIWTFANTIAPMVGGILIAAWIVVAVWVRATGLPR